MIKLNSTLIPAVPGRQFGLQFYFKDTGLESMLTCYYWMEAVDIRGGRDLMGPVWVKVLTGKK